MTSNLQFDFSVNKEKKTINVKRAFAASRELVWDAWTKAELLDLWWAPKPYRAKTKSMDFREGGTWLYAMISPEDLAQWCRADYIEIAQQKSFSLEDAFCDEDGNINKDLPRSQWTNSFSGKGDASSVDIVIAFKQLEDLEKTIQMGFKEGFAAGLSNLDEYFATKARQTAGMQQTAAM